MAMFCDLSKSFVSFYGPLSRLRRSPIARAFGGVKQRRVIGLVSFLCSKLRVARCNKGN